MGYKTYTRQMIADYTGRPLASFPEAFVTNSALPQAVLLFKLGTCLASTDQLSEDQQQLVDFGIIFMADAIHLSAPYQTALASPFSSETIGSYSYSKAAKAVQNGEQTGVGWFDRAIEELSVCDDISMNFSGGGIDVFGGSNMLRPESTMGNVLVLGPAELNLSRRFGYDPAPNGTYTTNPGIEI